MVRFVHNGGLCRVSQRHRIDHGFFAAGICGIHIISSGAFADSLCPLSDDA